MLQDSRGFMWFGTFDGLNKYDGYSFTIFKNDPDNPLSISDNSVNAIIEDSSGTLWIGMDGGGLNMFDRRNEQFIRYKHDPENINSLSNDFVVSLHEDISGIFWIGTAGGGLNKFDKESGQFTNYRHDPDDQNSLSHDNVRTIFEDGSGVLWLGTFGGGLCRFDNEKDQFISYRHDPLDPYSLSHDDVRSIDEDRSGTLWIGTADGLNAFDGNTERFIQYKHHPENSNSLIDNSVSSIFEDSSGLLWIGTIGGLNTYNRQKQQFTNYKHDPNNPSSLSYDLVAPIFEDLSGIIWIGTYAGLNKYDKRKEQFTHYRHNSGNPNSLSHNMVLALYEDQTGTLWIGTSAGGLNKYDGNGFTSYRNDPDDPHSLGNDMVYSICEDRSGTLWIGTFDGLYKFDRESGKFTLYRQETGNPQDIIHDVIFQIYEDRSGTLWIGTSNGLKTFDAITGEFRVFRQDNDEPTSSQYDYIYSIYEDSAGLLWLETNNGLKVFNRETEQFRVFTHEEGQSGSLSHNSVSSILEDPRGTLWIGTYGGGLNKFDRQQEYFTHYNEKDGLPNDMINGLIADNKQKIWISTGRGLSRFDPETEEFKNYDVRDGLQSNEFNGGAYCKGKDGRLMFGGIDGFIVFYPDSIKDNSHQPPVAITDFRVFNRTVPIRYGEEEEETFSIPAHISDLRHLQLSYRESAFSFEFSALHYVWPKGNEFAYMLEGVDKGWIYTDASRRHASYTNIAPGEYIFRVKASNSHNVWNEEGASIRITITPPFWKTWWVIAFYILVILSSFLGLLYWRTFSLRIRKKELEVEVEYRTQALNDTLEDLNTTVEHLKESQNSLSFMKQSVDHSTDAIIWVEPSSSKIIYANKAAYRELKYTEKEMLSKCVFDINPEFNQEMWENFSNSVIKEGKQHFETVHQRKDGSAFPVEIIADFIYDGESRYFHAIMRDISERKAVEAALNESLERFETLFNEAPMGIVLSGMDHRFYMANKEFTDLFGYEEEEIKNMTFADLTHPEDLEESSLLTRELVQGKRESFQIEKRYFKKNKELIWARIACGLLRDNSGKPVSILAMIQNTTYQKKMEDDLVRAKNTAEQANSAKSEFLANMSHEIRTPMNAILGFSELLSRKMDDPKHKSYIDTVYSSGKSLLLMINDLLDLSKVEAGKLELDYDFIHTRSFFTEIVNIFHVKMEEKDLDLKFHIQDDMPPGILLDELRIRQILVNLLSNAVKFTRKGSISIYIEQMSTRGKVARLRKDEYVDLNVRIVDTGKGIKKAFLPKVFDPFLQEDGSITKEYGGTGLGLAISKRLAKMMNGDILVESTLHKGSTFTLQLKQVKVSHDFHTLEDESTHAFDQIRFTGSRVLIADDHEDLRAYFTEVLTLAGCKPQAVKNGKQAYDLARKIKPELIIADINMPIMDGFELLKNLRMEPELSATPVIAVSASATKDFLAKIEAHKFDGFLTKPVQIGELCEELMKHLSYETAEQAIPAPSHIRMDAISRKKLGELITKLETDYIPLWEQIKHKQPINKVKEFGRGLKLLGSEYKIGMLTEYGDALLHAVEAFNVQKIRTHIHEFQGILDNLHAQQKQ